MEEFVEKNLDVLQNIEAAIVLEHDSDPALTDNNVVAALESLIDAYVAEKIGRSPRRFNLTPEDSRIHKAIRETCEWRMGRAPLGVGRRAAPPADAETRKTVDEIIACLKRILKSVRTWNSGGGIRGYLGFIEQHVG